MIFNLNERVAIPPNGRQRITKELRKRARADVNQLLITEADRTRLEALIALARRDAFDHEDYLAALEAELGRARVVPSGAVPADVVTMNSVVRLRDLESGEIEEFELVYPEDADMAINRISVLAPIGTAILGYRIGDIIEWPVPAGIQRFRVEEMVYQPERAGAVTVE